MKNTFLGLGWGITAIAAIILTKTDSEDFLRTVALGLIVLGAGFIYKSKNMD